MTDDHHAEHHETPDVPPAEAIPPSAEPAVEPAVEPAPHDEPLADAPQPQRPRDHRPTIWALSLLVVVLALVGTAPWWAPPLLPLLPWGAPQATPRAAAAGNESLTPRVGAVETTQRADEQHLAQIESSLAALSAHPAGGDAAALVARIDALDHQVDSLRSAAPDLSSIDDAMKKTSARLDALEARVAATPPAQQTATATLLAALADLRAAVAGGGPYSAELDALTALSQGDNDLATALQPLSATAATGLPSAAQLALRFDQETAPAILRANIAPEPSDGDLGARVLARVRSLVTIRRVDDEGSAGDPVAAAVARARAALALGAVGDAAAPLTTLSGAPAQAAASFLTSLEQCRDADAALANASRRIAARLAAGESH